MMDKWDQRFYELACLVATWSKDPSTQVGCVLVDGKKRVIGMGYNGFPRNIEDRQERYDDRSIKYGMVIHAEVNAVLNAVGTTTNSTAYVTHKPCSNCMGILIQAGISEVVYPKPEGGIAERFADSFALTDIMIGESSTKKREF